MSPNHAILVCFLVITPVVAYASWRFWKWYILQKHVEMVERGRERARSGRPVVIAETA